MKRLLPLFLAVALALPAFAVRQPDVISSASLARLCRPDGSTGFFNGSGTNATMNTLFDGDFSTNGVYVNTRDYYVVVDFSSLVTNANQTVYVSEIDIGHKGNALYSLFYSDDGTTWKPVATAQGVQTAGTAEYPIGVYATQVKYVFDTAVAWSVSLCEIQVKGYVVVQPAVVSKTSLATVYDPDGAVNNNTFGGGSGLGDLFNGKFDYGGGKWQGGDGAFMPRMQNGGYILLDFSSEAPDGYFLTEARIGQLNVQYRYSLYTSMDGTTWDPVVDAQGVFRYGIASYGVYALGKYFKFVFDESGGWTANICEIEVKGVVPADAPCIHPGYTAWAPAANSARCTTYGYETRTCTECGTVFTKPSSALPPLGHDYVSAVVRPGSVLRHGEGSIACSRLDWELAFPEPLNLVTTRLDGVRISGLAAEGLVQFSNLSVSSTGNGADEPNPSDNWGVTPADITAGDWNYAWGAYWYSRGTDTNVWVDFDFGTEVDLTRVDISLHNHSDSYCFYSVDDDTGTENQIKGFTIVRIDPDTGDGYHICRTNGVELVDIYEDPRDGKRAYFDALPVERDDGIPAERLDENGDVVYVQKKENDQPVWEDEEQTIPVMVAVENDYNQYQRFLVDFYETPVKRLRVRKKDPTKQMFLCEMHPYGTVVGAGKRRYRRETLLIFK